MHSITLQHLLSPAITFLASLLLLLPKSLAAAGSSSSDDGLPQIRQIVVRRIKPRRTLVIAAITSLIVAFAADGGVLVAETLLRHPGGGKKHHRHHRGSGHTGGGLSWSEDSASIAWVIYSLGNVLLWSVIGGWTIKTDRFVHSGLAGVVGVGFVLESVLLGFVAKAVSDQYHPSVYTILHLTTLSLRVLILPILLWSIVSPVVAYEPVQAAPTERDALLGGGGGSSAESTEDQQAAAASASDVAGRAVYGTFGGNGAGGNGTSTQNSSTTKLSTTAAAGGTSGGSQAAANGKGKKVDDGKSGNPPPPSDLTWTQWFARFRRLAPFLWPSKSGKLQLLAVSCLGILVLGRIVNVLVPQVLGKVVAALTSQQYRDRAKISPWPPLAIYVALRFCQGNGGILSVSQSLLWAPVMQYSDREMSMMTFNHLLDLSLAFHTKRKTGEILRILDRGSAINSIFQLLLMNVAPVLFDIAIAIIFFFTAYGWALAVVIAIVMFSYVAVSIMLTTWRTKLRRQMNEADVVNRGIHTDVLMNWESVKYFTSEQRESDRYRAAIGNYQTVEFKVISSLNLLNFVQNAIITIGLLAGSLIIAYNVTRGRANPGEFVVFLVYLGQLYGPLNSLGMLYRSLNSGLVDAEKLLKLLSEEKEVVDKPGAKDLVITDGVIEFKDVHFGYSEELEAISGISFKIEKGESVALVGESGSGKSSLLRLLYRFYDIRSGEILIDGQNIRDVTQKSLRRAIGIVPQDSVLWNDTIAFNIGYGREGASREEIEQAARAARLHERILEFPDKYETVVGERGVRLSGGEKQRVSLARTILKAPAILVLDEATSALDTENERFVQQSLNELAKGRSSLMIAHRLSTIVNAHKIIVLKAGKIIEIGSHKNLLTKEDGVFANMWKQQITSDLDAEAIAQAEQSAEDTSKPPVMVSDEAFSPTLAATTMTTSPSISAAKKPDVTHRGSSPVADDSNVPPFMVDSERGATIDNPQVVHAGMQSEEHEVPISPVRDMSVDATTEDTDLISRTPATRSIHFDSPQTGMSPLPEGTVADVPFPSERPGMSHSTSQSSGLAGSMTSSRSPAMTRSNSGDLSLDDKKKRNRLSSIGGLVRRVSEQGKNIVRSPGASPGENKNDPFTEGGRQKRFSLRSNKGGK